MDGFRYWDVAEERIPSNYEGNRAFQHLASDVTRVVMEQKVPPGEVNWQIARLYDAYAEFLYAMNPHGRDDERHEHWRNHFECARLNKKWGEPEISQEMLSAAASTYLGGPLRVRSFDRALIDAFIAQETFAYIDRHAGRSAFLLQLGCSGGGLAILVAIGVLLSIFANSSTSHAFWYVVGGTFVLQLVLWAWPKNGPLALYQAMRDTYQLLSGSVVSVPELRRRVELARDKGVVWPAELYAVLDDVEARTKVL